MPSDVGAMTTEELARDSAQILRRMRRQAAESLDLIARSTAQLALGPKTARQVQIAERYGRILRVTARQIDLIDELTTGSLHS